MPSPVVITSPLVLASIRPLQPTKPHLAQSPLTMSPSTMSDHPLTSSTAHPTGPFAHSPFQHSQHLHQPHHRSHAPISAGRDIKPEPLDAAMANQNDRLSVPYRSFARPDHAVYRGQHRSLEDDDDDDIDEDDEDYIDEDEDHAGFRTAYHSAYNTAYNSANNSAYNSCDEGEDVSMDGVAIKEDATDHEMADVRSSSSTPAHPLLGYAPQGNRFHPSSHMGSRPYPGPSSRSSSLTDTSAVTTAASASSPSKASTATPLVAIKPRPALRPLLPSRPTSPQPFALSRNGSSEGIASKESASPSSLTSALTATQASSTAATATTTSTTTDGTSSSSAGKTRQSAYRINGLNILNRNSLDSRTALEMLRRRRENHNHVERRRRDTLNSTILQIAEILPNCSTTAKLNKGTILRLALEHIRSLHVENHSLRSENAALRFFYQGSQARRNGPNAQSGPSGPHPGMPSHPTTHGMAPPSHPSHSHPHQSARGQASSLSPNGMTTPPIIPGPGQGTIPGLATSAASAQHSSQSAHGLFGAHMTMASAPGSIPGSVPGSVPTSAANSPPSQTIAHPFASGSSSSASSSSSSPSGPGPVSAAAAMAMAVNNHKKLHVAGGHLHPILPKSQSSRGSPTSSPRPRLLPHPSPSGLKPFSDAIRVGPSPLSSPCSSPPLAPVTCHSSALASSNALANALPAVPASHQHSAAASAAAAAAAAAAANAAAAGSSNTSGTNSPSSVSSSTFGMSIGTTGRSHVKGSSVGGGHSSHSSHSSMSSLPLQGHGMQAGSGPGSDKDRIHSSSTSPYGSPYVGPPPNAAPNNHGGHGHSHSQGHGPHGQGHGNMTTAAHVGGSHQHGHSPQHAHHGHHGQQQQQQQHHGMDKHSHGYSLPSFGSLTRPSSPVSSPQQGPGHHHNHVPQLNLPAPAAMMDGGYAYGGKRASEGAVDHPHYHGHHSHPHPHPPPQQQQGHVPFQYTHGHASLERLSHITPH